MDIVNGFIENIRVVPTAIDTHMITFVLGGRQCKAFNDLARMIEGLEGQEVQAEGFWRPTGTTVNSMCGALSTVMLRTDL